MPITFARRQGWFKEPKIDEGHEMTFSLEERWRRWRDREEIKRLGFAALVSLPVQSKRADVDEELREQVFDSMGTALWNHESSSLYLDAAKTTLPCHDSLWVRAHLFLHSLRWLIVALEPETGSAHSDRLAISLPRLSTPSARSRNPQCHQPPHRPLASLFRGSPLLLPRRLRYHRAHVHSACARMGQGARDECDGTISPGRCWFRWTRRRGRRTGQGGIGRWLGVLSSKSILDVCSVSLN